MASRHWNLPATLPMLLIFMGAAAYAATLRVQRTAAPPEDERRIAAVVSEFQAAWNEHDARRFAMVFAEDAEFTNVAGRTARGRLEVERFHSPRFATTFKDSRLTIERISIRLIRADVASVDAWWEMSGARTSQGDPRPLRKGQMHLVMTKDGDTWTILVMHNLEFSPP
jgi:uncharacterized protein (TIGR02246 family)